MASLSSDFYRVSETDVATDNASEKREPWYGGSYQTNPDIQIHHLEEALAKAKALPLGKLLKVVEIQKEWLDGSVCWEDTDATATLRIGNHKFKRFYSYKDDPISVIAEYGSEQGLFHQCSHRSDFILATLLFWREDPRLSMVLPHLATEIKAFGWIAPEEDSDCESDEIIDIDCAELSFSEEELKKAKSKKAFIDAVNAGELSIKNFSSRMISEFNSASEEETIAKINGTYDYLLHLTVYDLSDYGLISIENDIDSLENDIASLKERIKTRENENANDFTSSYDDSDSDEKSDDDDDTSSKPDVNLDSEAARNLFQMLTEDSDSGSDEGSESVRARLNFIRTMLDEVQESQKGTTTDDEFDSDVKLA